MKKHIRTEQEIINAVQSSTSIRQTLIHLNIKCEGGNYRLIKEWINKYNINISHFKGQGNNKGKTFGFKRDIAEYLSNNYSIQSFKLKNRLLKEGIFNPICCVCKNTTWLNSTIPLELDHIDGNSFNNTLVNLRLLCPNCHAQTSTYRGKNIGARNRNRTCTP